MFSYCSTGVSSQTIAPKEVYKNFTKKEHGLCNLYDTDRDRNSYERGVTVTGIFSPQFKDLCFKRK